MEITIPYSPRNWAKELHDCLKRWMVLVLHRRAGKTTAVLNHLQRDCLKIPKSRFAYIAPTYKQAKRIAWDMIKEYSYIIPGINYNESELTVIYPNRSKLYLLGSENIDSIRGIGLWGGCQDEASQQPSNLFSEVVSKCLADHLGYWIWLGTPQGKNEFFKTYQVSQDNPTDYLSVFKTIEDSLRDEKGKTIENLKVALEHDRKLVELGQMTQEEFDQEWYCSFESAIKGAYYAKEIAQIKKDKRFKTVPYYPEYPVFDVWDLGIGNKLAIGFYQKIANEPRMIDYWEGSYKEGIPSAVKACKDKPYVYGKHFAPHDVEQTSMSTEQTRLDTAKGLGWEFEVVPNLRVNQGIDKGKLFLAKLWIDKAKCGYWLDAMSQYHQAWDEKKGMFLDKPYKDWTNHPADVHRYASLVEKEMVNKERKPYKQPPVPPEEYEGTVEPIKSQSGIDWKDIK